MSSFKNCTSISPNCPIQATTYGYRPVLWANIALLVIFSLALVTQLIFIFVYRLWSFSLVIAAGCLLEIVGYVGRLLLHDNPWSDNGFRIQIICLILAPSLFAAGIYLTLKHLVIYFGPQYSRLRPKLYTWLFIGCDVGSIILQAAGIAFQVATMIVCGLLTAEFIYNLRSARRSDSAYTRTSLKAAWFCAAVAFAYVTILVRCIYRLPEMAGGWGGPMMRVETEFLVLDGLMIALAAIALTVFYPGYLFPDMLESKSTRLNTAETECGEKLEM